MVTTKEETVADAQMIEKKESKPTTTENHKGREQERKKGTKELQSSHKTISQMAVST